MRLDAPSWWYQAQPHWKARVLSPLAVIYDAATRRRMGRAPDCRLELPVICVGNFTAGGAGKTPTARAIADRVAARGLQPAFLTRGFGGVIKGPHRVDPSVDTPMDVGDEALLLASDAPTIVAADRAAGGRFLADGGLADVVILDDGLQNPALHKDLTLAVVDARLGVGNGFSLPAGPLRADLDFQMQRVDGVVVLTTHNGKLADADHTRGGSPLLSEAIKRAGRLRIDADVVPDPQLHRLRAMRVLPFAGIGMPQKFFNTVRSLGADVLMERPFPDHHPYTEGEASELLALAQQHDAQLLTTEKDWVRLDVAQPAQRELKARALPVPIGLSFARDQAAQLDALLDMALSIG